MFCWVTRQVAVIFHVVFALSFLQGLCHHGNKFLYFLAAFFERWLVRLIISCSSTPSIYNCCACAFSRVLTIISIPSNPVLDHWFVHTNELISIPCNWRAFVQWTSIAWPNQFVRLKLKNFFLSWTTWAKSQ